MSNQALAVDEGEGFTYRDYKQQDFAGGERCELIYGEVYLMGAPNDKHQDVQGILTGEFYNFFKGKPCKFRPAPYEVRLFYEEDESDHTVVQPDLSVICDRWKLGPEGCRGAPDLAVEILSPSNTVKEMTRKFELYRKAGVREYWEVNPENKSVFTHRFEDGKILTRIFREADSVKSDIFPGLEIPLETVFPEEAES